RWSTALHWNGAVAWARGAALKKRQTRTSPRTRRREGKDMNRYPLSDERRHISTPPIVYVHIIPAVLPACQMCHAVTARPCAYTRGKRDLTTNGWHTTVTSSGPGRTNTTHDAPTPRIRATGNRFGR